MKKIAILQIVILIVIIMLPMLVLAYPTSNPGYTDPDAPIDGGLSLLIVAGAGYGAKKLNERRANKEKWYNWMFDFW